MIQYYNTEAEYEAAVKSNFESQVSLVGADNKAHFDGRNVVVGARSALTGSVAVLDGLSALHFIAKETYNSSSFFSNFTRVGVVAIGIDHPHYRGKLGVIYYDNVAKVWSYPYSFKLTGYTLDGTDRTGTLSIREAGSWGTATDYVVSYNAESLEGLASQLNTFFQDTTNPVFQTQDWVAVVVGEEIHLKFHYTDYRQASNAGKSGFALTANLLPEVKASSAMHRYNGQRSGEGSILNMPRALTYFRSDLASGTYNPASAASLKRAYPLCLPAYLGTSANNSDQCADLRAKYGPGEEGWKRFMASLCAVLPSRYGAIGNPTYNDSLANTYAMAGKTFTGQSGTPVIAHPAADYCANISFNHDLLRKGNWRLPSISELASIMGVIKHGTTASRNADPINAALLAIGGTAVSNGASFWSSSRYSANGAWCFLGAGGCTSGSSMFASYRALPLVLLPVNDLEQGIDA